MIEAGKIPANILYQDDMCMAIMDVNPQAPVHFLVVPSTAHKQGLTGISKAVSGRHEAVLGHMMVVAAKVAREQGLEENGYRLVVNEGVHGCQSVFHLHIHVLGGFQMGWPPTGK